MSKNFPLFQVNTLKNDLTRKIKEKFQVIIITNNRKNSNNIKETKNKNSFPKKRDYKDSIKNDPYVQNWLISYSEKEKNQRLSLIEKFCEFTEKMPSELILEHRNDILQKDPLDMENIGKKQLLAYFHYLKGDKSNNTTNIDKTKFPLTSKFYESIENKKIDKEVSNNSARQYAFSKLASFYKRNNIPISFDKKEIPIHNEKGTIDKVWRNGDDSRIEEAKRIEHLKQIRDTFSHIRDKCIFLAKLSSGLDDIDLFKLKIGDFNDGIIGEFDLCYLNGTRIKTGMYYQTFFNHECVKMIELYLKERENKEEITNDKYLFVSNKYTKCKTNTFSESLKVVCRKLDIKNLTPKSLRRWFNTILTNGGINFQVIERLLGHKIDISKGTAYYDILNDEYRFAKEYSEKIESLTLLGNGNNKISKVDKRVNDLEQLNKNLVSELDKNNEKLEFILKDNTEMKRVLLTLFTKVYEIDNLDDQLELEINTIGERVNGVILTEEESKERDKRENAIIQYVLKLNKELK